MVIIPPSNFRISERDPYMVLRFKWNFFGGTYAQHDSFVRILRKEISFSLWQGSVLPWKRTRARWALATLRNYDGDGKENAKKAICLMSKTTTLHVHRIFLCISSLSLHNYNVKWPNFKFTWERERQGDEFYHLCLNSGAVPSLQLQTKFPSFK